MKITASKKRSSLRIELAIRSPFTSVLSTLPGAMSLSEKLIKSAKAGNSREVRKLLGRGVQITKDKVMIRFITEKFSSILIHDNNLFR